MNVDDSLWEDMDAGSSGPMRTCCSRVTLGALSLAYAWIRSTTILLTMMTCYYFFYEFDV